MKEYGEVRNRLAELIEKKKISKTKLAQRAEMQPTQLRRYYNNEVTRFDADVLARLCTVLECEIGDLLEFIPADADNKET